MEEGNPTSEGFLQAQQGTNKWRYVSLWDPSLCDNNAWEFLVGAHVGALGKLEEQRAISPEGYRAKRPWNRNCDEEQILLWLTRMAALNPVESMTAWSFEALMEIKPKFTECPRENRKKRGLSVGPVLVTPGTWGKQARKELSPWLMCTACHSMPK